MPGYRSKPGALPPLMQLIFCIRGQTRHLRMLWATRNLKSNKQLQQCGAYYLLKKSGDKGQASARTWVPPNFLLRHLQPDVFFPSNVTPYGTRMEAVATGCTLFTELHAGAEKALGMRMGEWTG